MEKAGFNISEKVYWCAGMLYSCLEGNRYSGNSYLLRCAYSGGRDMVRDGGRSAGRDEKAASPPTRLVTRLTC